MRSLNFDDSLNLMIVIDDLKLKDEIKKIAVEQKGKMAENAGFDVIWQIFILAVKQKNRHLIFDFLSGPFEMSPDDIRKMKITDLAKNFKEIADIEEWKAFLNSLRQMT